MPFWYCTHMMLFGKKEAIWPHKCPQSDVVIKSLGSWRQSICPLRFQSPTVKDSKREHRSGVREASSWSGSWESSITDQWPNGVATLVPQTNLPETPSYTECETLKAEIEGFQDHMVPKGGTPFLPGTSNGSWLTPNMPPLRGEGPPKMTRKLLQRNRPPNDYKASGLLLSLLPIK